jgi:DNA-directed RNA polymerase subunit RPC12/RpoP
MKLVPAKCPSCGADIEVNKSLEKTICQYCGTTVLIDDAVQKYKLEISGKVKVDGVKGRDDFLEQAKKHLKVKEYDAAIKSLNHIIEEDKFDVEAYCELIKNYMEKYKEFKYEPYTDDYMNGYNSNAEELFNKVCDNFDRVKKIDEKEEYKKYLDGYVDDVEKNYELWNKMNNVKSDIKSLVKDLKNMRFKASRDAWEDIFFEKIEESFMLKKTFYKCGYADADIYKKDNYTNSEIQDISLNGTFISKYYKTTEICQFNPFDVRLTSKPEKFAESPDELQNRIDDFKSKMENIEKEGKETGNQRKSKKKKKKIITYAVIGGIILLIALIYILDL